MKPILFFSLFFLLLQIPGQAFAQTEPGEADSYSIGLISGPLLPSKIPGVTEVLQLVGVRAGMTTHLGKFESEAWVANGSGVSYQSILINYRMEVFNQFLPVHALIGAHIDSYSTNDSSITSTGGGGWQVGGGSEAKILGPVFLRGDFEYRSGPGKSLLVLVALMLQF
jgi:hypothetical protein